MTDTDQAPAPAAHRRRREPGAIGPLWVDPAHAVHLVWLNAILAVISFGAWTAEQQSLVLSSWAQNATPLLCVVLLINALVLAEKPRWCTAMSLITTVISSIFLLGLLGQNLMQPALGPDHALFYFGCISQVFYPAVFAAFTQGAALVCWVHFGALAATLVLSMVLPTPTLHPGAEEVKLLVLLLHPCSIVALSLLVRMRHDFIAKEQAAHKNKEQMLAMISHEIRGPLQTMLSSVDLLSGKVSDAASRRALHRLSSVTLQLDRHLRDLVEFTRLDNPELAIHIRPYDLIALVDGVLDDQQAAIAAKGLVLRRPDWSQATAAHIDQWRKVEGDPQRMQQVLRNLIGNAVKYTEFGSISVSVSMTHIPKGWVQIDIKDTGAGIPADQLARIFEPFVRVHSDASPAVEGSGLGLTIASRLVQHMGGEIRAHSALGLGSQFVVNLPLKP